MHMFSGLHGQPLAMICHSLQQNYNQQKYEESRNSVIPGHAARLARLAHRSRPISCTYIFRLAWAAFGHGPPQLAHVLTVIAWHALRGCLIGVVRPLGHVL